MTDLDVLPEALQPFIVLAELNHVRLIAEPLFMRAFGDPAPVFPHHLVAFYRGADQSLRVLSYGHLWLHQGMGLSGGACTDGSVVRAMSEAHRSALTNHGGARRWVLAYTLRRFADHCDAYFAYSGNARARSICMQQGFAPLDHPHLLVNWHKPIAETRKHALLNQVANLGAF